MAIDKKIVLKMLLNRIYEKLLRRNLFPLSLMHRKITNVITYKKTGTDITFSFTSKKSLRLETQN